METNKKRSVFAGVCSVAYLLMALMFLLGVCGYCYPEFAGWAKTIVVGSEDSPVRAAFNVLSDCLEIGEPIKDAVHQSVSVLIDHED